MIDTAQDLKAFFRRSVRLTVAALLVAAVGLSLLFESGSALALGLLFGGAASMVRYHLSVRARMRARSAGALVRLRLINFVSMGLVLALAFWQSETISPLTAAIGLLAMNGGIIVADLLTPRRAS